MTTGPKDGERGRLPEAILLLAPPLVYVVGMGLAQGFGSPFMFRQFLAPGHDHSAVGLILIFTSVVVCPVLAVAAGVRWYRKGRIGVAALLVLGGLVLAAAGLSVRQPHSQEHPTRESGPSSASTSLSQVGAETTGRG